MTVFVAEKMCPSCGVIKPRTAFKKSGNEAARDRLARKCFDCNSSRRMSFKSGTSTKVPSRENFALDLCLNFLRQPMIEVRNVS